MVSHKVFFKMNVFMPKLNKREFNWQQLIVYWREND